MDEMKRIFLAALAALFLALPVSSGSAQGAQQKEKKPRVLLQTSMGDIVLELEPARTPVTVENFLAYVRSGHYDRTIFHRVISGFVIQGGNFTPDFGRKDTRGTIRNEADRGLPNERGTIAMARTPDPHSASDQFFINIRFNGMLNHRSRSERGWGYTAFGRVVEGMNIASRISRVATGALGPFPSDMPLDMVILKKARILSE
jgi:cyclophilin family peptidyl-prolyl cis-trans isomerase